MNSKQQMSELLKETLNESNIPEDALQSTPEHFPTLSIQNHNDWDDDSSGEDSFLSIFEQSVGTEISNVSEHGPKDTFPQQVANPQCLDSK